MLLRLAGVGLAAGPLPALAAGEGGPPAPSMGPGSTWTEFFKGQRIWAYADRLSLKPGEPLNVMAAAGPGMPARRVRLEVFRLGAAGLTPVWTSDFAEVAYHGATASASAIGPGWRPTFANIDTTSWGLFGRYRRTDHGDPGCPRVPMDRQQPQAQRLGTMPFGDQYLASLQSLGRAQPLSQ